jgi:hypothetical protein
MSFLWSDGSLSLFLSCLQGDNKFFSRVFFRVKKVRKRVVLRHVVGFHKLLTSITGCTEAWLKNKRWQPCLPNCLFALHKHDFFFTPPLHVVAWGLNHLKYAKKLHSLIETQHRPGTRMKKSLGMALELRKELTNSVGRSIIDNFYR